ncbi:MAG: hypothetical protein SPD96_02805 [Paludibacteraceae bacterium]|nr:hypothetical protein [Paludibacteraceae bacterium]
MKPFSLKVSSVNPRQSYTFFLNRARKTAKTAKILLLGKGFEEDLLFPRGKEETVRLILQGIQVADTADFPIENP